MKSREFRETFLSFFEERGHRRVPSASIVPGDDPTLLFTNAGMNQFKDVFLGHGRRDYTRAVDTQKCIRVSGKHNDLEEVGVSPWHHTFFEMLGNWSFGDYFKEEAITWGWELVTERLGLEKERLWATVFEGSEGEQLEPDEEAESLWVRCTDLPADRIVRLGSKDNFWEMGETGPCGPCSEIHYFLGDDLNRQSAELLRRDSGDFVEIWNLVFIQFNREPSGSLQPLPAKHVDTGMGFERMCSLLQRRESNYDTDVFQPLISGVADLTAKDPGGEDQVPMRVISDHVRTLTVAISDGVLPSNDGRGYVMRRLLRRAARFGRKLDQHEPFIHKLTSIVADQIGAVFPEVAQKFDHAARVIRSEEESFGATLDRGLDIFEKMSAKGELTGADTFMLHDTYGFPLDLTELMARERGLAVDTEAFERELEAQRARARRATRDQFTSVEGVGDIITGEHSQFVGYTDLSTDAQVVDAEVDGDGGVTMFLDRTPFYAEAGGQVGDRGLISGAGFAVDVENSVRGRGGIMHVGRLRNGSEPPGGAVRAEVDATSRAATARNHTATHLLNEALRRILGDHVSQMGSLVAPGRLRFDFSHFAAVEPGQIREVEALVNEQIRADSEILAFEEELDTARKMGAQALFGEKYDNRVRVVQIGEFSLELCGGTHVETTGRIGSFALVSEGGVAAGTRRVEAVSGDSAVREARRHRDLAGELSQLLSSGAEELADQVCELLRRNRELERQLEDSRRRAAADEAVRLVEQAELVEGVRVATGLIETADTGSMRNMADGLRENLGSGVGVLGAVPKGKASFIAVVTDDLIASRRLHAGDIVRAVAELAGGSGGGKPHMAQAGGREPQKVTEALAAVPGILSRILRG